MKKIFCLVAAVTAAAMITVVGAAEFSIVSNNTKLKVGEEADITITAKDISELSVDAGSFTLEWDNNFEFVAGSAMGIENGSFNETTGIFTFSSDSTLIENEVLLTFKLLALSQGTANLNLTVLTASTGGDPVPVNNSTFAFSIEPLTASDVSSQLASEVSSETVSEITSSQVSSEPAPESVPVSSEIIVSSAPIISSNTVKNPATGDNGAVPAALLAACISLGALIVFKRAR